MRHIRLRTLAAIAWGLGLAVAAAHGAEGTRDGGVSPQRLIQELAGKKHPYLLFTDIHDTPGWKNKDRNPWGGKRGWDYYIRLEADRANAGLLALGMAYQLTGDPRFARRAAEKLSAVRIGVEREREIRMEGAELVSLGLAYDWVQTSLTAAEDQAIRDRLAKHADVICRLYPQQGNAHDRIIAGAGLGVMGLALAGYAGSMDTMPVDWLRHGTIHLFFDDHFDWKKVTPFPYQYSVLSVEQYAELKDRCGAIKATARPAVCGTCNFGGFCDIGGYRAYWLATVVKWLNVYHRATGRNPLDDFPIARAILNDPIWESMPTRMDSQQNTRQQHYWAYGNVVLSMLTPEERGAFQWYETDPKVDQNRWRWRYEGVPAEFLYCVYRDDLPVKPPFWTSFYSPAAESCVLRGSWDVDSDWLFFKCQNYPVPSHRCMLHNDNMSFELYTRGDYLLSDGGEVRSRMHGYGPEYASGHNTLLVDGHGPVKEDIEEVPFRYVNTPSFTNHSLEPWFELVEARCEITKVELDPVNVLVGKTQYSSAAQLGDRNAQSLTTPVTWQRAILYPAKEYFVVIDAVRSEGQHDYEVLFQLSSFDNVVKGREIGHVAGKLTAGGKEVDWAAGVFADVLTGDSPIRNVGRYPGNAPVCWETVNLLGKRVVLRLVPSLDADRIDVRRGWGRVAQTKKEKLYDCIELDHPFVSFRRSTRQFHQVTALLAHCPEGEVERKAVQVKTIGEGSALRLEKDGAVDLIGAGHGRLQFDRVSTDAEISFVRERADRIECALLIRGQELQHKGKLFLAASGPVAHVAFHPAAGEVLCHARLEKPATLTLPCDFPAKTATYQPDSEDWIWVWTEELRAKYGPRPLGFRTEGGAVVLDCPPGSGKIVVR